MTAHERASAAENDAVAKRVADVARGLGFLRLRRRGAAI